MSADTVPEENDAAHNHLCFLFFLSCEKETISLFREDFILNASRWTRCPKETPVPPSVTKTDTQDEQDFFCSAVPPHKDTHETQRRERLERRLKMNLSNPDCCQRLSNAWTMQCVCVCMHRTSTHMDNKLFVETTLSMTVKAKICLSLRKICMQCACNELFSPLTFALVGGQEEVTWGHNQGDLERGSLPLQSCFRASYDPLSNQQRNPTCSQSYRHLRESSVMCSVGRWFSEDAAAPGLRSGCADILSQDVAVRGVSAWAVHHYGYSPARISPFYIIHEL